MSPTIVREQQLLRLSLGMALVFAALTIAFALLVGAQSILFDGVYTIVEAAMTGVSLATARLIAKGDDQVFQLQHWPARSHTDDAARQVWHPSFGRPGDHDLLVIRVVEDVLQPL